MPMATTARLDANTRTSPRSGTKRTRAATRNQRHAVVPRIAIGSPARIAALVVIGAVGLIALAAALDPYERFHIRVIGPLRRTVEPQAEKLWTESQPLRRQIASFFQNTEPRLREQLIRNFQSWIGHFRAT